MRKWEDIVRDKMEEPEGALPESVFAEFHSRRDAAAAAPAHKRFPLVWAVVPAVAAGLAAVLFLHRPAAQQEGIQVIQQPSAPVASVADSASVREPEQACPILVRAVTQRKPRTAMEQVKAQQSVEIEDPEPKKDVVKSNPEEESVMPQAGQATDMTTSSPLIPEGNNNRTVGLKVGSAAGIVAGGGLLAAVAAPLLGAGAMADANPTYQSDFSLGGIVMEPDTPKDERTGDAIHYFPIKFGLSARFPVSERLSITTGLDYSWYKSSFTYSLSGEKIQNARYLGIPVRLDWTLASGKWLDVYLGGGVEGDWCIGATLAGERIAKDGFSASLLGAGGIQFNPTKLVGLYLEPQLSWTFTPGNPVLETYRTENLLMFSLAAGLRFTIGK